LKPRWQAIERRILMDSNLATGAKVSSKSIPSI